MRLLLLICLALSLGRGAAAQSLAESSLLDLNRLALEAHRAGERARVVQIADAMAPRLDEAEADLRDVYATNVANFYSAAGREDWAEARFAAAEANLRKAHDLAVRRFGAADRQALIAAARLAIFLMDYPNALAARREVEALLARVRSGVGEENVLLDYAIYLSLGRALTTAGRYSEARGLIGVLARASREAWGLDRSTVDVLELQAEILLLSGAYADALALYDELLPLYPETHRRKLDATFNRATALTGLRRYDEALAASKRAEALDQDGVYRKSLQANLALALAEQGELDRALALYEELFASDPAPSAPRSRGFMITRANHANALVEAWRSDPTEERRRAAASAYETLLDDAAAVYGRSHPVVITIAGGFAQAQALLGEVPKAVAILRRYLPEAAAWEGREVAEIGRTAKERNFQRFQSFFSDFSLSLAVLNGDAASAELAAEAALRLKQLAGEANARLTALAAAAGDERLAQAAREVAARRGALANALTAPEGDGPAEPAAAALERATLELRRLSKSYAAYEDDQKVGLAEVQRSLDAGEALLEFRYFDLSRSATRDPAAVAGLPRRRIAAVLIRRDAVRAVDLGAAEAIETALGQAVDFEDRPARRAGARRLATQLLGPLESDLAAAERLYISPDGALHAAPFDLLPYGEGYLIERFDLRIVATGRALARTRQGGAGQGGASQGGVDLVAFGGVDFDADSPREPQLAALASAGALSAATLTRSSDLAEFVELPESGPEVEALAEATRRQGWSAKTLIGREALESEIKALNAPPRVLHLATHGFFLADPDRADIEPMALSGLAFTGANLGLKGERGFDGDEDGVLWAIEVASLPLQGVELVALSACDTAKGVVSEAGEGVYGLGRAFQIAGAENVMLTLWALFDEDARLFMESFYETWLGSDLSPAEALRATKLAWLRSSDPWRSDPEVWAPFVLVQSSR